MPNIHLSRVILGSHQFPGYISNSFEIQLNFQSPTTSYSHHTSTPLSRQKLLPAGKTSAPPLHTHTYPVLRHETSTQEFNHLDQQLHKLISTICYIRCTEVDIYISCTFFNPCCDTHDVLTAPLICYKYPCLVCPSDASMQPCCRCRDGESRAIGHRRFLWSRNIPRMIIYCYFQEIEIRQTSFR